MTQLKVFEMERVGVMVLEGAENLFAHPFHLRFGKLDHVVRDVIEKRQRELGETRFLTPPQLIQQLRQLQYATLYVVSVGRGQGKKG